MNSKRCAFFSECKPECAQLILEQSDSYREAARAVSMRSTDLEAWLKAAKTATHRHNPGASPLTPEQRRIRAQGKHIAEQFPLGKNHTVSALCRKLGIHRSSDKYWHKCRSLISPEQLRAHSGDLKPDESEYHCQVYYKNVASFT